MHRYRGVRVVLVLLTGWVLLSGCQLGPDPKIMIETNERMAEMSGKLDRTIEQMERLGSAMEKLTIEYNLRRLSDGLFPKRKEKQREDRR